jgi:alkylation response protein AidB-like acyl-CoA dehydrogenase
MFVAADQERRREPLRPPGVHRRSQPTRRRCRHVDERWYVAVELILSDAQQDFRHALRTWLLDHHPGLEPAEEAAAFAFRRSWQRTLHDAGWLGLSWPIAYGGRGLSAIELAIFNEELVAARAPRPANLIGLEMGGPTILAHGTEKQKLRYLPPLLSGEEIWCQGFSEPQAGSDLAAVRTRASRVRDGWIVNGQKVWTSFAHESRWCLVLVRTDHASERYSGLSYLIVDMEQPAVTVRPIRQITGEAEFNELFFDDAWVPAEDILGAEGDGWTVATTTLMHERANLAFALATDVQRALADLLELLRVPRGGAPTAPAFLERLGRVATDAEILRLSALRTLVRLAGGAVPGPEASLNKWRWSQVNQALTELALDVVGDRGPLDDDEWNQRFLRARANSIEGGTTEVLKNIIAERVLGLPRAR